MRHATPALICLITVLVGCKTPYEKAFDDFQISDDVFSITSKVNQHTSEEINERYLFRRASEVALANGFRFFEMISGEDRTRVSTLSSVSGQSSSYGTGASVQPHGSGRGLSIPLIKSGKSVWIKCYKERPKSEGVVVNAKELLQQNYPDALAAIGNPELPDGGP